MEQVYMKNTGAPHAHAPPRARAGRRRRRTVDGRASGRRGGRGGQCRSWNTLSLSLSLSLSSLLRIHGQKAAWIKNHLYKYERGSLRRRGPEPRRRSRAAGARSRGRSTLVIDAIGASQTLVIFGGQWKKKVREKEEREREREREREGKEVRTLSIGSRDRDPPADPFSEWRWSEGITDPWEFYARWAASRPSRMFSYRRTKLHRK